MARTRIGRSSRPARPRSARELVVAHRRDHELGRHAGEPQEYNVVRIGDRYRVSCRWCDTLIGWADAP